MVPIDTIARLDCSPHRLCTLIRRVLQLPDPVLRERSDSITKITKDLAQLAQDMFQTMHANAGLGLAAPQIGVLMRLVVIELPPDDENELSGRKFVLINPELELKGSRKGMVEGCLSLPGFRAMVERDENVTVAFTQLDGTHASLDAKGLFAQAVQHEVDHLNGVLFIDHLASLARLEKIPPEPLDWVEEEEEEEEEEEGA